MNGTTTVAQFREAVLDPAKRRHYELAWLSTVDHKRIAVLYMLTRPRNVTVRDLVILPNSVDL